MKIKYGLGVVFILLSHSTFVFSQKLDNKITKEKILDITPDDEIYDITLNNNWKFSGFVSFDKENIYIALRYLPSDLLGNITDTYFTKREGKEKEFVINRKLLSLLDIDNLSMKVLLSEDYFKSQVVNRKSNTKIVNNPISAGYVNYNLNMPINHLGSTRGLFDFNYNSLNNWSFKNGDLWNGNKSIRLNTTFKKQFDDKSLLMIGDTNGNSISGFSTLNLMGVRYASAYYNAGIYVQSLLPNIPISGFAVNPTKLDLFLGNQLVQSNEINSGKYNLEVPLQQQGMGTMNIYTYDLTGKPVVTSIPFYGNNEVVKEGGSAYDISFGSIRKNYGTNSFDYQSSLLNILYKKGFLPGYTQDFFIQHSPLYSSAITVAHLIPNPNFGMINFGIAKNSQAQTLIRTGYEKVTKAFAYGGNLDIGNGFCFGFGQSCIKQQGQLFFSTGLPKKLGNINLSYTTKTDTSSQSSIASIQWSRQFGRDVNIYSTLSQNKSSSGSGLSLYIGLSMDLGKGKYSNSSLLLSQNSQPTIQTSVYQSEDIKNPEKGYGSINFNDTLGSSQTVNGYYGKKTPYFNYQINALKDSNGNSLNTVLEGAIAYVPEANYVSFNRQMQGALTFVQVDGINSPVPIIHENKFSGYTDNKGRLLIPDSNVLNTESVAVDINKMDKSISIENFKQKYFIPFSGAVKVNFKAKEQPFVIQIKGAETGVVFNIENDYYVIGDNGFTSVDSGGKAIVPIDKDHNCELNIHKEQKEYDCTRENK